MKVFYAATRCPFLNIGRRQNDEWWAWQNRRIKKQIIKERESVFRLPILLPIGSLKNNFRQPLAKTYLF